jgi:hypothetical protein
MLWAELELVFWWVKKKYKIVSFMGYYTQMTQAVSRMNRKPARNLKILKTRLLKAEGQNA